MGTHYHGHGTIGDVHADIEIANVDVSGWNGTATNLHGAGSPPADAVVMLFDQPRPGWSAKAGAIAGADGVVHLSGTGYFRGPVRRDAERERRSVWVRKLPRAT